MVFFANLGVNLRGCLCGVLRYASAQPLDFLDLDKKSSFLNWKLASARKAFLDGHKDSSKRTFKEGLKRMNDESSKDDGPLAGP
ncbi:MAG: hypothetical protein ACQET7_08825 [Thermodesulfobacteriota bacterium]